MGQSDANGNKDKQAGKGGSCHPEEERLPSGSHRSVSKVHTLSTLAKRRNVSEVRLKETLLKSGNLLESLVNNCVHTTLDTWKEGSRYWMGRKSAWNV